jgi:hypothetical protein
MTIASQLIDHIRNWLRPSDEEPPAEPPMTAGELIRTIIGLVLIDALFTFGFAWWGAHDPRIAGPLLSWFVLPMVSVLAGGMALLQVYFYTHPDAAPEPVIEALDPIGDPERES